MQDTSRDDDKENDFLRVPTMMNRAMIDGRDDDYPAGGDAAMIDVDAMVADLDPSCNDSIWSQTGF